MKLNLALLLELVSNFEKDYNNAEDKFLSSNDKREYIISLAKVLGLAASVSGEAAALTTDIKYMISEAQQNPLTKGKVDAISELLQNLSKPSGSAKN